MSPNTCQIAALPLLFLAQAGLSPSEQTDPDALTLRLGALAGGLLDEGDCRGLVVLAGVGDDVVFEHGWGTAAETGPGELFRAGSLVEQMVVVRTLQLAEEGRLALDDPVGKHLPEPRLGGEDEDVRVRDLIAHTSGLQDYVELDFDYEPGEELALLARVAALPLETTPGSCCSYSRTNILALGLLVERLDEITLPTSLATYIFEPVDFASTRSARIAESPGARALQEVGQVVLRSDPGPQPFSAEFLVTDAADLLRWQRGLVDGTLLPDVEFEELTRAPEGSSVEACAPAFQPVTLGEYAGVTHGGGMEGDRVHIAHYPALDFTVVVLAHGTQLDAASVARAVTRAVFDIPAPQLVDLPLSPAETESYIGTYQIGCTTLQIAESDGHLVLQSEPHGRVTLLHQGGHVFLDAAESGLRLTFQFEGSAPASGFELEERGTSSRAMRFE